MDFTKFFKLDKVASRAPIDVESTSPLTFAQARLIARGEATFEGTLRFRAVSRGKAPDILLTDRPGLELYSSRFFEILERGGFSGWSRLPAHVEGLPTELQSDFQALVIKGRSGNIDYKRSEKGLREGPRHAQGDPLFKVLIGAMFPPDSWDGSDIFLPGRAGFVYVVDEVRHALDAGKVRGIRFTRIDQWQKSDLGEADDPPTH